MNNTVYQCIQISDTQSGTGECIQWQAVPNYSGYKLTNAEISQFVFAIAALFATVAAIKIVRRAFF